MKTEEIIKSLELKHPGEPEYIQAVREVLMSIEDIYNQHPEFEKAKIIERLVEPDRMITFRVTWVDDKGEVQTNTGYRVQFMTVTFLNVTSILPLAPFTPTPRPLTVSVWSAPSSVMLLLIHKL